ncbi:beta-1,3-galactosyltransferase 1 [Dermacentor silvarum]|uniref:beta-1,3-galactosyltransferase 1 n=1 Tax=Dermacentor silvarum TaxID=543639 RepID=UPI001897B553|nr:beta-1,3-galactosyltransferase 1 [Dermacentor silvarum]
MASSVSSWSELRSPKCPKIRNRAIAYALFVSVSCLILLPTTYRDDMPGCLREPFKSNASRSSSTPPASVKPVPVSTSTTAYITTAKNATGIAWKVKKACGSALRVLYYVHTAPEHFDRRRLLRDTIGNPAVATFFNSSVAFFVGKTTNADLNKEVRAEAEYEGDVVVLEHVDTYRNLTLKFIGATKWLVANRCLSSSTGVVVKLDDDVIVNVFLLASYVEHYLAGDTRDSPSIHCATMPYLKPIRDRRYKWFVTKKEYASDTYPPYCCGAAYLMKASVLTLLEKATHNATFFWVDDVYATGLLTKAANVTLVNIRRMCAISPPAETTSVSNYTLFLHWGMTRTLFLRAYQLWASVLSQNRTT